MQNKKSYLINRTTYQQNFNTAKNVHGTCKSGAQVETDSNSPTKLRPQRARYHVIWTSSCESQTHKGVTAVFCAIQTHYVLRMTSDVHSPGTTPFVAMALMEIAVSMVWKSNRGKLQNSETLQWRQRWCSVVVEHEPYRRVDSTE